MILTWICVGGIVIVLAVVATLIPIEAVPVLMLVATFLIVAVIVDAITGLAPK